MANQNKKIKTDASGVYDSGFSGAPAGSGRGSFEPKGKGFGQYTKTFYSPDYIKPYTPEELSGAYEMSNQNKSSK